ncbi:unnamed protein product [Brassica napus]|uniref:(rape) hypothetical protein n=1 Tax=Brassica napus TaxID=3708 RepID=A0A816KG79_BRANA|nr:unnamed protein product [Brassica napus]
MSSNNAIFPSKLNYILMSMHIDSVTLINILYLVVFCRLLLFFMYMVDSMHGRMKYSFTPPKFNELYIGWVASYNTSHI